MKLTVHFFDDEIDSIPIAATDRETRSTDGGEEYRYVLRSEWRPVPTDPIDVPAGREAEHG